MTDTAEALAEARSHIRWLSIRLDETKAQGDELRALVAVLLSRVYQCGACGARHVGHAPAGSLAP